GDGRTPARAGESGGGPERDALRDALGRHRWIPMAAARELGISRAPLYRRVRRPGIRMPGPAAA
ncbi:helix-turn-helix domain-containing protein, partial [Pseudomonas aeruginosa]